MLSRRGAEAAARLLVVAARGAAAPLAARAALPPEPPAVLRPAAARAGARRGYFLNAALLGSFVLKAFWRRSNDAANASSAASLRETYKHVLRTLVTTSDEERRYLASGSAVEKLPDAGSAARAIASHIGADADVGKAGSGVELDELVHGMLLEIRLPLVLKRLAHYARLAGDARAAGDVARLVCVLVPIPGRAALLEAGVPRELVQLACTEAVRGSSFAAEHVARALRRLSDDEAQGAAACVAAAAPLALVRLAGGKGVRSRDGASAAAELLRALRNMAASGEAGRSACAEAGAQAAVDALAEARPALLGAAVYQQSAVQVQPGGGGKRSGETEVIWAGLGLLALGAAVLFDNNERRQKEREPPKALEPPKTVDAKVDCEGGCGTALPALSASGRLSFGARVKLAEDAIADDRCLGDPVAGLIGYVYGDDGTDLLEYNVKLAGSSRHSLYGRKDLVPLFICEKCSFRRRAEGRAAAAAAAVAAEEDRRFATLTVVAVGALALVAVTSNLR
jgi:hypothetical protein